MRDWAKNKVVQRWYCVSVTYRIATKSYDSDAANAVSKTEQEEASVNTRGELRSWY